MAHTEQYNWIVTRTLLLFKPENINEGNMQFETAFLCALRSINGNIAALEAQLIGGKIKQGERRKASAKRKILEETGLIVPEYRLKSVGEYVNETDGKKTLTHLYVTRLNKHPRQLTFNAVENQGLLTLGTFDGFTAPSLFNNEKGQPVFAIEYANDTRVMIEAGLKLDRSMREKQ